jgi:hypothetical protein
MWIVVPHLQTFVVGPPYMRFGFSGTGSGRYTNPALIAASIAAGNAAIFCRGVSNSASLDGSLTKPFAMADLIKSGISSRSTLSRSLGVNLTS